MIMCPKIYNRKLFKKNCLSGQPYLILEVSLTQFFKQCLHNSIYIACLKQISPMLGYVCCKNLH